MAPFKCNEIIRLHFSKTGYGYQHLTCDLPADHEGECEASIKFPLLEDIATTKFDRAEFIHPPIGQLFSTNRGRQCACHPKKRGTYEIRRWGADSVQLAQDLCFSCANEMIKILNGTP